MWTNTNNTLKKEFKFNDFSSALGFIIQVGLLAEKHNHHPKITNVYNQVILELTTHDEGNIVTEKDQNLSKAIDQLL